MVKSHLDNGARLLRRGALQCYGWRTSGAGGVAGRRTVNSVRPGTEVTLTVPPWAVTID